MTRLLVTAAVVVVDNVVVILLDSNVFVVVEGCRVTRPETLVLMSSSPIPLHRSVVQIQALIELDSMSAGTH